MGDSETMFEASRDASLPPERKTSRTARPPLTPIAYRPADAAHVLGVSRSTIYQMMADGKLEARHLGGATLIAHEELLRVFKAAPLTPHSKFAQKVGK